MNQLIGRLDGPNSRSISRMQILTSFIPSLTSLEVDSPMFAWSVDQVLQIKLPDTQSGKSGVSDDGTWYGVFRHELGHNFGSNHYEGGAPEGPTILSGNSLARMSSYEIEAIMDCRASREGDPDRFQERLGAYRDYPIPPYARLDHNIESIFGSPGLSLDVMANDHDANDNAIALAGFDEVTDLGGSVSLELGTGPSGRDQLSYTPPSIMTGTTAPGNCGPGETLSVSDCQTCVSYFDQPVQNCSQTSDCGKTSICVGNTCRNIPGCADKTIFNACGEICPNRDFWVWLDSSDTENLESTEGERGPDLSHGDTIRRWFDRSGQGLDAITYADARSPSFQSTGDHIINGRPTLRFTQDFMELRNLDLRPGNYA